MAQIQPQTRRNFGLEEKAAAARAVERHVLPLFEMGRLEVPIAATYPLDHAAEAYQRFAAGGKFGKVVLTVP